MKTQRFGIEIEMTGLTRKTAADTAAKVLGGTVNYTRDSYDTYEVKGTDGRVWKLMSDASISAENSRGGYADGEYKVELVSPICTYPDIETVQNIIRALRKAGAKVNNSCGIHVHIDAKPHTARSLKNLANIVASKENLLFKALAVDSGRQRYCEKASTDFMQTLNNGRYTTTDAIKKIWYKGYDANYEASRHYSGNL